MGCHSLMPGEAAAGQAKEGRCVQLDDVGRGAAGVPATVADAQLDGGERRHAQFHRPARVAQREETTNGTGPTGQVGAGELGRRVVCQGLDGGAQRRYIGC